VSLSFKRKGLEVCSPRHLLCTTCVLSTECHEYRVDKADSRHAEETWRPLNGGEEVEDSAEIAAGKGKGKSDQKSRTRNTKPAHQQERQQQQRQPRKAAAPTNSRAEKEVDFTSRLTPVSYAPLVELSSSQQQQLQPSEPAFMAVCNPVEVGNVEWESAALGMPKVNLHCSLRIAISNAHRSTYPHA